LRAAADRITDPEGAEPGNLKDLINAAPKARQADMPGISGPPRSAIIGPLQQALNESKARREGYAADSVAAGKLTAGLTTAPTPRLNTELGRRTLGATAAATAEPEEPPTSPAPTLTRPEMTGRLNAKFYGPEGYVDPKHAAKVAEMEKTKKAREEKNRINMGKGSTKQPAMDRLFGPKPSFLQGSLAGSYYDALNK
jgi:hypothetical protein